MNLQFYLEKLFASEKFQSFVKENPSAYFCSGFFSIDRQRENPLTTSSKRGQSKEDNGNKIHIDYIIPETKKIFSFQLNSAPNTTGMTHENVGLGVHQGGARILPRKCFQHKTSDEIPSDSQDDTSEGIDIIPVEQVGDDSEKKQVILAQLSDNIDFDFKEIEKMIVKEMEEQKIKSKIQKILLSLQKINTKDFLVGTVFISGLGMIKIKIDLEEMIIVEFEKKSFFDMMKIVKK